MNPIGSKLWRWKYRVAGKEKLLALGSYPVVSLQDARQRHEEARRLLAQGQDPSELRKAQKTARVQAEAIASDTFERVARDWMAYREAKGDTTETTAAKDRWRLEAYLFPHIGQRPITEITAIELRDVLKKMEDAGKHETASRSKITAGQVFRWAVLEGRANNDVTASLRRLFATPKPPHRATITDPKQIGELLRAIEGFSGQPVTLAALKLAPLVFVRPGELRQAEWSEFDLDESMWRIPGERMKMKAAHLVPLSTEAVAILRELHKLTDHVTTSSQASVLLAAPCRRTPSTPPFAGLAIDPSHGPSSTRTIFQRSDASFTTKSTTNVDPLLITCPNNRANRGREQLCGTATQSRRCTPSGTNENLHATMAQNGRSTMNARNHSANIAWAHPSRPWQK